MTIAMACPRCGRSHCIWSEDELFCPDCLLQEGFETFKYRENNPYWYLSLETFSPLESEEDTSLTPNINPAPIIEEFEFHHLYENQIPTLDIEEEERIELENESERTQDSF